MLGGQLDNPVITADFNGYGLSYFRFPCDSLAGKLSYQDGQISFNNGYFAGQLANLNTLEPPLHIDGLSGGLAYRGNFSGVAQNPRVSLLLALDQPTYGEYQLNWLELDLGLTEGSLLINTATGQKDSLLFLTEGSVSLRDSTGTVTTKIYIAPPNIRNVTWPATTGLQNRLETGGRKIGNATAQIFRHNSLGLSVTLRGNEINLGILAPFAGVHDQLGGILQFSLETPLAALRHPLALEFQVENPSYEFFAWDSISGRIIVMGDDLIIESLALNLGSGPPLISASVTLAGYGNQGLLPAPHHNDDWTVGPEQTGPGMAHTISGRGAAGAGFRVRQIRISWYFPATTGYWMAGTG
ncbi:hypothetical protein ACFL6E_02480 [Candidatus Neomarinimicrobiota bacterium]